jgi:hypothetical protein
MPQTVCDQIMFFRRAFVRQETRRYALMLPPEAAARRARKYDERCGVISDTMIHWHLMGLITLAAPAAHDGQACVLPLDVDAGGMLAIEQLIAAAEVRGLWSFGQYCPRPGLDEQDQHGYVWLIFEEPADAGQLQLLGEQLITSVLRDGWKIEARAHASTTRLPLSRHTHTGRFGWLIFPAGAIVIDDDPAASLIKLRRRYRENPISNLPSLPLPAPRPQQERHTTASDEPGITIDRYNDDNDLIALLHRYGARRARGSRRLLHCCGHDDSRRASLLLWTGRGGKLHCKCLSEHHNCVLAHQMRDPFGVYCAMEGLSTEDALRRLNGKEAARCR